MGEKKYKNPLVTLEELNQLSRTLLYKVHNIYIIEHILLWKSDAQILMYKYMLLLHEVEIEIEILKRIYQKEDTEFYNQNMFMRMVSLNPALKIQFKIDQMQQALHTINEVIGKLEYWITIAPESLENARELSFDLQMYKNELLLQFELFSRNDFDLQTFIVKLHTYTSYGKYSQFERTFVNFVKHKNIQNVQEAKECIQKLIRIIDETIIWYENFIRRS